MVIDMTKSEKKIAIITLYSNNNFGNKLQNYATQCYFEKLGCDVFTIPYWEELHPNNSPLNKAKDFINNFFYWYYKKTGLKHNAKRSEIYKKRYEYIKTFSDEYIKLSKQIHYKNIDKSFSKCFDYFVTGSDQVWHCTHDEKKELEYFFLMFAAKNQRITMSPSFGFDNIPEKYYEMYKNGILGFNNISCREQSGVEIIKNISGIDAELTLDPTMLVDKSIWTNILKRPANFCEQKYLLVYCLGGYDSTIRRQIEMFCRTHNLCVVDLYDEKNIYFFSTRPDEFLYWIKNAEYVLTNSFHAVVFSILFKKQFYICNRVDSEGMENRIETLLSSFQICNVDFENNYNNIINYDFVDEILYKEKVKAANFYLNSFVCAKDEIMSKKMIRYRNELINNEQN